jgi:hypothetical protein
MARRALLGVYAAASLAAFACNGKVEMPTAPSAVAGCDLTISPPLQNTPPSGGSYHTTVTGGCGWTAESDAPWIAVTHGDGAGVGAVTYTVQENPASVERVGRVRIGDEALLVRQVPLDCTFSVQPPSLTMPVDGGSSEFHLSTAERCAWSATSTEGWLSVSPANGTGPQAVALSVLPNARATERSAQIRVGDRVVNVKQPAATSAEAVPPPAPPLPPPPIPTPPTPAPAPPAPGEIPAPAPPAPGPAPSPGPAPQPTPQPPPEPAPQPGPNCEATSLAPSAHAAGVEGGAFETRVDVASSCSWTAETADTWIALVARGGSGAGVLAYRVAPNAGSDRAGTIRVAGRTLQVTQTGCSISVSPDTQSVPAGRSTQTFSVDAGSLCAWKVVSDGAPIAVIGPTSGAGKGTVTYEVAANDGRARSGRVGASGTTTDWLTVNQAAAAVEPCAYALKPATVDASRQGGRLSTTVIARADCGWVPKTSTDWIALETAKGSGEGALSFTVRPHTGSSAREGTVSVEGTTLTVRQAGCDISVGPTSFRDLPYTGGDNYSFTVKTDGDCAWSASAGADWIRLGTREGRGSAVVNFVVSSNTVRQGRSSTITVAGVSIEVTQSASLR